MGVKETFDRSAQVYDRARRQLIPCFDQFYGSAIAALPAHRGLHVVDLGAGTGLFSMLLAAELPNARFTLIDIAPQMLDLAREHFVAEPHRFSFKVGDVRDVELPHDLDCVVSALAIHHLEGEQKAKLFHSVFAALPPGGVFINADQVAGLDTTADTKNRDEWLKEVRSLGTSQNDLLVALERMNEDRPSTIDQQLTWLSEAGFEEVECTFEHTIFAVMVGRKSTQPRLTESATRSSQIPRT